MRPVVAAIAVLLFPGTAAAAPWSPPQHLSSAHTFVDDPALTVAGGGRTLATWRFQDGIGNAARSGVSAASRAPGGSVFGIRRRVPGAQPVVEGYRQGAVLLATPNAAGTRVFVRFGHADGSFGARRTIRRGAHITDVSLAVNVHGDAAVAWFENRGVRADRVYVALRRAGRAFGAPRRLATGRIRSVAAAVGAKGDVVVAWDARGVLRTRYKGHRGPGFRRTDTIRSEDAFFADLHPVVTPSGRAVLAWTAQFASEGGDTGPVFVQEAVRPAGGPRFHRAILLDRVDTPQGNDRHMDAVNDGSGVAIAWTPDFGGHVKVARSGGAPQDLGPGALSDLAAGPAGRLIVVWDDGVEANPSRVHASLAPFTTIEDVSPADEDARFGAAAFRGAVPTIVYSGRPQPSRTFAEAVTRSE